MDNIGDIIKRTRKLAEMNQQTLADLAGVSRSTISEIENGKATARIDVVKELLRVLNIGVWLHLPDGQEHRWI